VQFFEALYILNLQYDKTTETTKKPAVAQK